jgi:MFS family permease
MTGSAPAGANRPVAITALGVTLILAWGSSYYLPAVLAGPIAQDTGWPLGGVVSGLSVGLLVSGLCAPFVGRAIQRRGGRPVLAAGSLLLAAGLAGLAVAPSLAAFLCAWAVVGAGMSAGLYDAAFATAGRLWGRDARGPITALTLWGGFASTVCWPLSAWLIEAQGWRATCLAYAGLHLVVALPLHLLLIPGLDRAAQDGPAPLSGTLPGPLPGPLLSTRSGGATAAGPAPRAPARPNAFVLLAAVLTLTALVASTLSVHVLALFQLRGYDLAAAVGLGALLGPAQVGARVLDLLAGQRHHPIRAMTASVALIVAGLGLLLLHAPSAALAVVLYGAGNGLHTIARGALPLALFGPGDYAVVMGRLALPSLVVQALAPTAGAWLLVGDGTAMLATLTGIALASLALCLWLRSRCS